MAKEGFLEGEGFPLDLGGWRGFSGGRKEVLMAKMMMDPMS